MQQKLSGEQTFRSSVQFLKGPLNEQDLRMRRPEMINHEIVLLIRRLYNFEAEQSKILFQMRKSNIPTYM